MNTILRIYFAHPINTYGTVLEHQCLMFLAEHFPGIQIINPNSPEIQGRIAAIKNKYSEAEYNAVGGKAVMTYFFNEVIPSCDACVGLQYPDGTFMAGTGNEMLKFLEADRPVWRLTHRLELSVITDSSMMNVLGVKETRERIYFWPTRTPRPYPEG
jgi:hypothetical protein